MMSEKPENRMPRSQPARAASVVTLLRGGPAGDVPFAALDADFLDAVFFDAVFFDAVFCDPAFKSAVFFESAALFESAAFFEPAVFEPSFFEFGEAGTVRPRGVRAPAGFAGRRGVLAESPFITPPHRRPRRPRRGWPPGHPRR